MCSIIENIEALRQQTQQFLMLGDTRIAASGQSEVRQMKATFDIFEKDGVLHIAVQGDPTVSDIKQTLDQTRDASGYNNLARLWDFRKSSFEFTAEELEEIASHASTADLDPARVAMLVSQDLSYGVSRIYEAYRKSALTDVKVFRDEAAALEWLLE